MHFLRFRSDMRYWQDKSADLVIADVFGEHPQARGAFQFPLSKPLPPRSYCRQSESDWNFVHRLMEEEGLFGFWRQDTNGKASNIRNKNDAADARTIWLYAADAAGLSQARGGQPWGT